MLIPDAGVGLYNAIPNDLRVIQSNVNQSWIVAGDSLYSSDLFKPDKLLLPQGIEHTAWAIAWHPMNNRPLAKTLESPLPNPPLVKGEQDFKFPPFIRGD